MDERDDELMRRTRAAYQREVEDLDPIVRQRLASARREALAALDAPARAFPGWVPAGAAAAVALTAVGVALTVGGPRPAADASADRATELEMMLGEDDLALYAEDPEFYAWVEEQTAPVGDDAG